MGKDTLALASVTYLVVSIQLVFPASGKAAKTNDDMRMNDVSIQLVFPASGKEQRPARLKPKSVVSIQLVFPASGKVG